jgi:hypothetical protein
MRRTTPSARGRRCIGGDWYITILLAGLLAGVPAWTQMVPVPDPTAPNTLPVNPNPHAQIRISGVMPHTLVIRLFATYLSTTPLSKNPCGEWVKGGDFSIPLAVTIPLDVTPSGGVYEATALADKFDPGKCGWHFYGISYTVNGAGPGGYAAEFVDHARDTDRHVKLWCGNNVRPFKAGIYCLAPRFAFTTPSRSWGQDPRQAVLARLIPEDQRGSSGDAVVPRTTTSLLIDFYDIDALVKDAPTQ